MLASLNIGDTNEYIINPKKAPIKGPNTPKAINTDVGKPDSILLVIYRTKPIAPVIIPTNIMIPGATGGGTV